MSRQLTVMEQAYGDRLAYGFLVSLPDEHADAAVHKAIEYMDAFNARDEAGTNRAINFPHVRLADTGVPVVSERPDDLMPPGAFDWFISKEGWHHSCWDHIRVVHSSPTKVHLDVQFTRYREDGSVIGVYPSLWVITCQEGQWGIQMRSSFAW